MKQNGLKTKNKISRKTFLRIVAYGLIAAFASLWNWMASSQKKLENSTLVVRINAIKLGSGIHWFDKFIIVKSADTLKIFSNRCTHAGCRINSETDGQLLCACHGSRFEASTGIVLRGPARLPLAEIPYTIEAKTKEILIKI